MHATNRTYLANLDHLRALAAFMVFTFHFIHNTATCRTICLDHVFTSHSMLFSTLEEGHTGVALFMCLSGYIFAYLTHKKTLHIAKFAWNRFLRLSPLLFFWNIVVWLFYTFQPMTGAWSVFIEFQFYSILPAILIYSNGYGYKPLIGVVVSALAYRYWEWYNTGDVMMLSYYTIVGRLDQLMLGMAAYYIGDTVFVSTEHKKLLFNRMGIIAVIVLTAFYYWFASNGGYQSFSHRSIMWVFLPTIEGVAYSCIILAYLQMKLPQRVSTMLTFLGTRSYSLYLNQFYVIPAILPFYASHFDVPDSIIGRLVLGTFYGFPIVTLSTVLTYQFIEKPFLKYRANYLSTDSVTS